MTFPEEKVYELILDHDNTFDQWEAPAITRQFVCGVCHGELNTWFVPNSPRVLVGCVTHGNVCDCGRVMRSSVSIQYENEKRNYLRAIRALPDLWGELIPAPRTREQNLREMGF